MFHAKKRDVSFRITGTEVIFKNKQRFQDVSLLKFNKPKGDKIEILPHKRKKKVFFADVHQQATFLNSAK